MQDTADAPGDDGRPGPATGQSAAPVIVEVEEALGPGLEFQPDPRVGWVGIHARRGDEWHGFDRAGLLGSHDGRGSRIPVLVAMPVSTFRGCRLRVEMLGGWRLRRRVTLLAVLPGTVLTRRCGSVTSLIVQSGRDPLA